MVGFHITKLSTNCSSLDKRQQIPLNSLGGNSLAGATEWTFRNSQFIDLIKKNNSILLNRLKSFFLNVNTGIIAFEFLVV